MPTPTETLILEENFDDGIRNGTPWTYDFDVTEENGHLAIWQSVTDDYSAAFYNFDDPVENAKIIVDRYHHAANNNYFGQHTFDFETADGGYLRLNFSMLRSNYAPIMTMIQPITTCRDFPFGTAAALTTNTFQAAPIPQASMMNGRR